MATKLIASDINRADAFYVELVGPDGLKHHVGPFEGRRRAEDWIIHNESTEPPVGAREWALSHAVRQPR